MRRRRLLSLTAAGAGALLPTAPWAQDARKVRHVGVMARPMFQFEALKEGLRELGYHHGGNIVLHRATQAGTVARLESTAVELVRLGVEVIVAGGAESVQAARDATASIPIVMTLVGDPVGQGFVQSLARPGGNITGLSNLNLELAGKWIELLTEVDPKLGRIGVLWNEAHPTHRSLLAEFERAVGARHLQLSPLAIVTPDEIGSAIAAAGQARIEGLVVPGSTLHIQNLARIADSALRARMASIAWTAAFVSAGGLMAYGASEVAQFRRAATFVDKILKGARPADLPVEQPTRFELAVNLRTAKTLGLTIPPTVLARADEVIE